MRGSNDHGFFVVCTLEETSDLLTISRIPISGIGGFTLAIFGYVFPVLSFFLCIMFNKQLSPIKLARSKLTISSAVKSLPLHDIKSFLKFATLTKDAVYFLDLAVNHLN